MKNAALAALTALTTVFAASCSKTPAPAVKAPATEYTVTNWNDSSFTGTTDKIAGPPWRTDGAVLTYRNPQ